MEERCDSSCTRNGTLSADDDHDNAWNGVMHGITIEPTPSM